MDLWFGGHCSNEKVGCGSVQRCLPVRLEVAEFNLHKRHICQVVGPRRCRDLYNRHDSSRQCIGDHFGTRSEAPCCNTITRGSLLDMAKSIAFTSARIRTPWVRTPFLPAENTTLSPQQRDRHIIHPVYTKSHAPCRYRARRAPLYCVGTLLEATSKRRIRIVL